jgi:hypothetical protein
VCCGSQCPLGHVDVREKSDLEKKKTTWKIKKKAYIISGPKIILPSENGV